MQSSSTSPLIKKSKPSKMKNIKCEADGFRFASKKERARYGQLKLLLRSGAITELQVQPKFELVVRKHLICRYFADFSYYEGTGPKQLVVEDVKGRKSGGAFEQFRIKAKLMKAIHGIDVVVI